MRRREFIAPGCSVGADGLTAHAQKYEQIRRIGVLMTLADDDPEGQRRVSAFQQKLQELGWTVGRNVQMDEPWAGADANNIRKYAEELVALAPHVIQASGSIAVGPLLQVTHTVPIVFTIVPEPVGAGFVSSLARPGGNATGFMSFEYGLSAKWLEVLKQIAPRVTRAAVLRDTGISGVAQLAAIQSVAPSLGVEVIPLSVRDAGEVERGVTHFARSPDVGLIVTASAPAAAHRQLIISLAAQHKLPAVYWERYLTGGGGLVSYGPDYVDQYRRAAGYVDRILKGEKPADLPIEAPSKYQLVINLNTAKALGITIPPSLLARADEVI